jgi:uncharacterized membrane protein YphA (DoxX/SURF4 family)
MNQPELNFRIAELFVRFLLGILFVFQGYDKLFVVKIKNVINTFKEDAERKSVPDFLIAFTSYFTSITEFIGGIFLILGLCHNIVYIMLGINLILVSVAFSFLKPVWELHHVFPRAILLTLTLLLSNYFYFGVDTFFLK